MNPVLVDRTTTRGGSSVEEVCIPEKAGGFLLQDRYRVEVEGSEEDGGVTYHTEEFVIEKERESKVIKLLTRGPRATMVIKWHGAPILSASGADTGDGDDIPLSSYSEVKEALPFLIRSAANGTCLLYTSPSPRDGLLSRMPSSA